jgi:hypothetical protein
MKKFTHFLCLSVFSLLGMIPVAKGQYCNPTGVTCTAGDYIQAFSTTGAITNVNNVTGCNGYTFYSSMTVTATQGTTFNLSITNGSWPTSEYFAVYVDFNQDFDFVDAGENIYTAPVSSSSGQVFNASGMVVPIGATPGTTRMRVVCSYAATATPCLTSNSLGDAEDYVFVVLPACEKPTNVIPSNISSTGANFNWNAVSGAAGYEYVVSTSSTAPTGSGTPLTTNSTGVGGLNSNTQYYFHVRTKCSATAYSLWVTTPFLTTINPCPYPVNIQVNAPTATSVNFTWNPVAGSQGYDYVVSQSSANPLNPGTPTSATNGSASGLTPGGTYYVYIRNQCSSVSWSDWSRLQFVMPTCDEPVNVLFSNITDTSVDAIWSVMAAAQYYEYQVDQNRADPAGGGSGFSSTTGMTAHFTGLSPFQTYYLHVRSRCFINDSSDWALDSFVTQMGCLSPQVTLTNANTSSPSASWDPVPYAVSYEYTVKSSPAAPAFGAQEIFVPYINNIPVPMDGKNYYLHVRAKCNSMWSFSNWTLVRLNDATLGVQSLHNNGIVVSAYPNPANDKVTVSATGATTKDATIAVTDMAGRVLRNVAATGSTTDINIAELPTGIYLLKYSDGEHIETLKLSKQ